jgi:serine/threonine protein kinase
MSKNIVLSKEKKSLRHNVIGEGSYGCVHKPSLKCNKTVKNVKYRNKISKILLTDEAENEMKEYNIIANIDKDNGFFLGKPVLCKVDKSESNLNAISKCEEGYELLKNIDNESLLIMDYGGENLDILSNSFHEMKKTEKNIQIVKTFLKKASILFNGVKFLYDHNIIHHDMKPQNILYNTKNNRVNFIDFGFTTYIQDMKNSYSKSDNWLSKYHWSYPLEINFMNYDKYVEFAKLSENKKKQYYESLVTNLKNGENDKCTMTISILFSYIIDKDMGSKKENKMIELYLNDFNTTLLKHIAIDKYEEFVNKSLETTDLYGVGITFFLIINSCKHLLKKSLINDLNELCYFMTTPDVFKRYNITQSLDKYNEILLKNDISSPL